MRKFLLLLVLFLFVSCGGGIERVVQVTDENHEQSGAESEGGNQEKPDKDAAQTGENGGHDENQDAENPVTGDDSQEITDADNAEENVQDDGNEPENDSDTTVTDEENLENDSETNVPDEDTEPENPDDVWSVCGVEFSGSNCIASSCETAGDCCEADICVATDACGGAKVCRKAFFKENFDSYVAGNFPKSGPWTLKYNGAGDKYQMVTSEKYVSEQNSMHLLGKSDWAAVMTTVLPQVPTVINVEMKMNTQGDDVYFALCTFNGGGKWGNYDMKVTFVDGKISYQIPEWSAYEIAPSYEPNEWYKIRFKLDQANKTVSVWLNDELKVDNQIHNFDSLLIPNLCLSSNKGQKKVWFDDIFVWGE